MEDDRHRNLFRSFKDDLYLLLKGLKFPLKRLGFKEDKEAHIHQLPDLNTRLAALLEEKQKLNQQIEKIQKQLELLRLSIREYENNPSYVRLLDEGRRLTLAIQNAELQINRLRRQLRELKDPKMRTPAELNP